MNLLGARSLRNSYLHKYLHLVPPGVLLLFVFVLVGGSGLNLSFPWSWYPPVIHLCKSNWVFTTYREVVDRLYEWHQDKAERIGKLRVETQFQKDEQAVEGCTFKPTFITPKVYHHGFIYKRKCVMAFVADWFKCTVCRLYVSVGLVRVGAYVWDMRVRTC